ncbi:hypothetical protein [Serratia fonticola]|uniref:hypothetical protein n=1 Tax=Serratia fonticola TaxID=47917 RepID=UPI001C46F43D|nr:hypothetical protein [Serratia fonticola]QXN62328.1 hypothetical protein J8M99_24010 [Serratia fonticola]
MKSKKIFQLDERKLSDQWLFRLAILVPLVISILLCIPLWLETSIDLSAKGYDKFLNLYKLPIGILSLSIPLVAIVAHIHRTIQTAEQIQTTRKKNITDSFFSHHKFMIDAFSKIPSRTITLSNQEVEYKIEDPYHVYDNLFKGSSYENGIVTTLITQIKDKIEKQLNSIEDCLFEARDGIEDKKKKVSLLIKIEMAITSIESQVSLGCKPSQSNGVIMARDDHGGAQIITDLSDELELKEKLRTLLFLTRKVFQILNISIETGSTLEIYSLITTPDHNVFNQVFSDRVPTRLSKSYSLYLKGSNKILDQEFEEYMKDLEKQKLSTQ